MGDDALVNPVHKHLSREGTLKALCDTCRGLLIQPDVDLHADTGTTYYTEQIREAARYRCPICTRLHESLCRNSGPLDGMNVTSITASLGESNTQLLSLKKHTNVELPDIQERTIFFGKDTLCLQLGPYISTNGHLKMQMERLHATDPLNVPVASSIVSHSGSDLRFATMKAWLHECTQNHSHCQRLISGPQNVPLPTRLIEVWQSEYPFLVLTEQLVDEPSLRYATLSHRWCIAANMPLLLKDNLLELQNGIPINNLPKVFRDAIAMCRRLGIDYIWIDSLCLIQDDAIDCEREIANMGNIYTNAFLNFGRLVQPIFQNGGSSMRIIKTTYCPSTFQSIVKGMC
jgi:hypothetical protein